MPWVYQPEAATVNGTQAENHNESRHYYISKAENLCGLQFKVSLGRNAPEDVCRLKGQSRWKPGCLWALVSVQQGTVINHS